LIIKRPGNGITPENISKIIGKKSNKNYSKDELIKIKGLK
jgi:sialic acid synthase SpsE